MNRSILIVICDFLLVSLLAFSNFDNPQDQRKERKLDAPPPRKDPNADIVGALQLALDDERANREKLASELTKTRESIQTQQSALTQREAQAQQALDNLRRAETQTRQLEAKSSQLEQQRSGLQRQVAAAQTNMQALQNSLTGSRSETRLSQEQLRDLQAELTKQQMEANELRQRLTDVQRSQSNVVVERQQLSTKLQVVEAEKRLAAEQVATMRAEVQTIRAEKAQMQANTEKLATGVSALAEKSQAIAQELREQRAPLTANSVFNEFRQNRIEAQFETSKPGAFGNEFKKEKKARTILISDGKQTVTLFHIEDTPFTLTPPDNDWQSFKGFVARGLSSYPINRVTFLAQDPRLVVVPVDAETAQRLGGKVYQIASDPFKFQDAVVVGANEGYYGECKFQIDLATPQYVKMDRSFLRGLVGKFNPTHGDLVLSRTGEMLGIMVNDEYCAVLNSLAPGATIQSGNELRAQQAPEMLSRLHKQMLTLPPKLH